MTIKPLPPLPGTAPPGTWGTRRCPKCKAPHDPVAVLAVDLFSLSISQIAINPLVGDRQRVLKRIQEPQPNRMLGRIERSITLSLHRCSRRFRNQIKRLPVGGLELAILPCRVRKYEIQKAPLLVRLLLREQASAATYRGPLGPIPLLENAKESGHVFYDLAAVFAGQPPRRVFCQTVIVSSIKS